MDEEITGRSMVPEEDPAEVFRSQMEASLVTYRKLRRARFKQVALIITILSVIQIIIGSLLSGQFTFAFAAFGVTASGAMAKEVAAARQAMLALILGVVDPRLVGAVAELVQHERKDVRQVAEMTVSRLLPQCPAARGRGLSPKAVDGLITILRRRPFVFQAISILHLLGQRHEERAREIASRVAASPKSFFEYPLTDEEEAGVRDAAERAVASIQLNQEQQRLRQTLLRPAEEGEERELLRPAVNADTVDELLLRPGSAEKG